MRVYVDVDDTLILWINADEWEPDERLMMFCQSFLAFTGLKADSLRGQSRPELIIWSLGGADYARDMWRHSWQRVFGKKWEPWYWNERPEFWTKYPAAPEPGDLFFDDDPLESYASHTVMFPRPKR